MIDLKQSFQFKVANTDSRVYTWHPDNITVTWYEECTLKSRVYGVEKVLEYLANGAWVLAEDTNGWYDRKEYPPIGTKVRLNPGIVVTVVGRSTNGDLLVEEVKGKTISILRVRDPEHLKPLEPTAHERMVEAVAADLMVTPCVAESIILKGYRKQ